MRSRLAHEYGSCGVYTVSGCVAVQSQAGVHARGVKNVHVCVCVCVNKSNYSPLRGRRGIESGSGRITPDNSPGHQLHTLFTSLTKQMCWTDAAVMRCAWVCVREREGEEEKKGWLGRKGMMEEE